MKRNTKIACLMIACSAVLVSTCAAVLGLPGVFISASILGLVIGTMEFSVFRFVSKDGWE